MTHHWDELSKSLAEESLPRRESLRRLGVMFAGAVLSPLGLGTAWARGPDPCKDFCNQCAKSQRSQCLAACRACASPGGQLCGGCGNIYCADLASDPDNCGACGYVCDAPGPYEYGTCINGNCEYACAEGAVYCDGICTFLGWDPYNCGACGNVCPAAAPYCQWGTCVVCPEGQSLCNGVCSDLASDPSNCGGCGQTCAAGHVCSLGVCCDPLTQNCFGNDGSDCPSWQTRCGTVCVDTYSDENNCGGCGIVCPSDNVCYSGMCINPDQPPPAGY